jgi:Uma2 family endonuclease
MPQSRPRIPYTYADYKSLPESMDRRYELLGGELYRVPAPTTRHQRVSRRIELLLCDYVESRHLGEVFDAPVDVVFGVGREREIAQPDLVYIARERAGIVIEAEIAGAPDLIVDPKANFVEVYVLNADGYGVPSIYASTDVLQSSLLTELQISLDAVFRSE